MTEQQPYQYKVNLDALIQEISLALADKNHDAWTKAGHDNDLRRDLVGAINTHGLDSDGTPGIWPHVQRAIESGQIKARNTFNDIPALGAAALLEHGTGWYVTLFDADKLRQILGLPAKYTAPETVVNFMPPPYIIGVAPDAKLLAVEEVLESIARAKYGQQSDDEPEPVTQAVEIQKMMLRGGIREAFQSGILTARYGDGQKYNFPPASERFLGVYLRRSQFAQFADAEWLVTVADIEQAAPDGDAAPNDETPEQRRARWLAMVEAEERHKERGANARARELEEKRIGRQIDASNFNTDVRTAREERAKRQKTGEAAPEMPNSVFSYSTIKVIDGKRQN